jgi:LPXTG-site transpeptidase (sortase) family protein
VVVVGLLVAVVGGWLEYTDKPVAADPSISGSPSRSAEPANSTKKKPPAAKPTKPKAKPSTTTEPPVRVATSPGRPQRISVPYLGVSAAVIGIKAKGGSLDPPSNPRVVGWWSDGAKPGAKQGSAVLTGHTVHNGGGAFDKLDELSRGDKVLVVTDKGRLTYEVDSVTTYRKQSLAKHAQEVFDQGVPGRLVLVTCEDWNGSVYLSNAVVVAHRAD